VRGPDRWCLPGGLVARFGRCAAKSIWFDGFRLAILTPLIGPVPGCWVIVPAAVNERAVRAEQVTGWADIRVLADTGLRGTALTTRLADRAILVLTPPTQRERATLPKGQQRYIAAHRNRIESGFTTEKDQLHLEPHRARTPWGLLTRVAGKLAAFTLRAVGRRLGREVE
jgi:hypothetical protein